jgi:hypothetical protein
VTEVPDDTDTSGDETFHRLERALQPSAIRPQKRKAEDERPREKRKKALTSLSASRVIDSGNTGVGTKRSHITSRVTRSAAKADASDRPVAYAKGHRGGKNTRGVPRKSTSRMDEAAQQATTSTTGTPKTRSSRADRHKNAAHSNPGLLIDSSATAADVLDHDQSLRTERSYLWLHRETRGPAAQKCLHQCRTRKKIHPFLLLNQRKRCAVVTSEMFRKRSCSYLRHPLLPGDLRIGTDKQVNRDL